MFVLEKSLRAESLFGAGSVLNCKDICKIFAEILGELKHLTLSLRYNITIIHQSNFTIMAAYSNFTDKFNNEYKFDNYIDFARFWFSLSRKEAKIYFPANFTKLQNAAANSKEARTKV